MIFDDLVDFVRWCQHSGHLRLSDAAAIIVMLLHSRKINANGKQHSKTNGSCCNELTEHIDEGVGQEVAVIVGDIALVDGAGSSLHNSEDDGVVLNLPAEILRGICSWITGVVDVTLAV